MGGKNSVAAAAALAKMSTILHIQPAKLPKVKALSKSYVKLLSVLIPCPDTGKIQI